MTTDADDLSHLPLYNCKDDGVWLNEKRPPELYATATPLPKVPDMFTAIAKIIYANTVDNSTVVACSDPDHKFFDRILIVYDPAHRDVQYHLYPRGKRVRYVASFTTRTVKWMLRENEAVDLDTRVAFAAWVLWSWFGTEPAEEMAA